MSDAELEDLLSDLESDRVERKASAASPDKIREAICAFANDLRGHKLPGIIFIGVRDNGACAGLPITDKLLLTLSNMRSDGNIVPLPMMSVQKKHLSGCELAVIVVEPATAPPVRYNGRVCVRIGPRRAIASEQEEGRLTERRRSRDLPYDLRPVSRATIDDLDLDLFQRSYLPASVASDVLDENHRTLDQQLASLRMAVTQPEGLTPTVLGLLVTGKDPRNYLPGAYVQFTAFDGPELSDPVRDSADIGGPLLESLRMVEEKIEAHLETARDFTSGPVEVLRPDYPLVALQQIVRNAILHRTYENTHAPIRANWFSDRIEIMSPGGPYGHVTRANFGHPGVTDYRNPHLAEAMKNLGFVQKFGAGIALARRRMSENGNPPVEFVVEDTYILVTLRRLA